MSRDSLELMVSNVRTPGRDEKVKLIFDSGVIITIIDRMTLERLKIKPIGEDWYRMPDQSMMKREKGAVIFRLGRRIGGADVVFGRPGEMNLLGWTTLLALGLAQSPWSRALEPIDLCL